MRWDAFVAAVDARNILRLTKAAQGVQCNCRSEVFEEVAGVVVA